jgi:outer membrane protein OmpA-like peptidoglycan-associated protein
VGVLDQTYLICSNCGDDKPTIIPNLVAHACAALEPSKSAPPIIDKKLAVNAMPLAQPATVAKQVHFGFDSAELLPETISVLDRIETGKALHLEGFSCTSGTDMYNLALSQKRADAVSLYLKKRGITVLSAKGLGRSTVYPGKPLNRRVDIIENKEDNGP